MCGSAIRTTGLIKKRMKAYEVGVVVYGSHFLPTVFKATSKAVHVQKEMIDYVMATTLVAVR